jgi:hypothetical protein
MSRVLISSANANHASSHCQQQRVDFLRARFIVEYRTRRCTPRGCDCENWIGKRFCAISTNLRTSAAIVSERSACRCGGGGCSRKLFSAQARSVLKFRAAQAQLRRVCATRKRCVPRDRHR